MPSPPPRSTTSGVHRARRGSGREAADQSTVSRAAPRVEELRADVHVHARGLEPRSRARRSHRGPPRAAGRTSSPRARCGSRVRVGLDPGRDADEDAPTPAAAARSTSSSASMTTKARPPRRRGRAPRRSCCSRARRAARRGPGPQRERELAERRDVRAEPSAASSRRSGSVRERLDAVDEERVGRSGPVRLAGAQDRRLVVDDERRPVLGGEVREADPGDRQLAVHERGSIGEELDQGGHGAGNCAAATRAPAPGRRVPRPEGSSSPRASWPASGWSRSSSGRCSTGGT